MKPGYKSTELGALVAGILVPVLNKKLGLGLDETEVAAIIGLAATYIGSRAWLKGRVAQS